MFLGSVNGGACRFMEAVGIVRAPEVAWWRRALGADGLGARNKKKRGAEVVKVKKESPRVYVYGKRRRRRGRRKNRGDTVTFRVKEDSILGLDKYTQRSIMMSRWSPWKSGNDVMT